MRSVLRTLAAFVLSLGVVISATGWLYLARPHAAWPGPQIHDALPLDELSHRGTLPLFLFLAVWGVAALLLGELARWARADRLTAALLLALGVGAWAYAVNGMSRSTRRTCTASRRRSSRRSALRSSSAPARSPAASAARGSWRS
jgi:hypothetical protein